MSFVVVTKRKKIINRTKEDQQRQFEHIFETLHCRNNNRNHRVNEDFLCFKR